MKIINTEGEENVPYFDVGFKTEVDGSCSIVYENEFYILGGKQIYSQISKIEAGDANVGLVRSFCTAKKFDNFTIFSEPIKAVN